MWFIRLLDGYLKVGTADLMIRILLESIYQDPKKCCSIAYARPHAGLYHQKDHHTPEAGPVLHPAYKDVFYWARRGFPCDARGICFQLRLFPMACS